jgi:hypothetical protein
MPSSAVAAGNGGRAAETRSARPGIRTDEKISKESLAKPGFESLWKVKLPDDGKGLRDVALLDRCIGYRGFRSLAFLGGNVAAIDTDLNRVE